MAATRRRQLSWLACPMLLLLLGVGHLPGGGARGPWSRASTFCHMVATESGRSRFLSFLWRRPGGGPSSVLVQSAWDAQGGHLLDCVWQPEPAITSLYRQVCAQQAVAIDSRGGGSGGGPLARVFWGPELQRDLDALAAQGQDACRRAPGSGEAPAKAAHAAGALESPPQEEAEAARGRKRVRRGWTMPGTLWCGAGDSAGNVSELGVFQGPDVCCREHDQCEAQIAALGYKYGMRNYRLHTISHCDCDTRFKQCLLNLNDSISNLIGVSFFNLLEIPCFVLEESEECLAWHWWGGCKQYGLMPSARVVEQSQYHYDLPLNERSGLATPSPHPRRHRGKGRKHGRKNHWNEKRLGPGAAEGPKPDPDHAGSQSVVPPQSPISKPDFNAPERPRPALVTRGTKPLQSTLEATSELGLDKGVTPQVGRSQVQRSHAEAAKLPNEVVQSGKLISGHGAMSGGTVPAHSCNCYRRMDQCPYMIAPNEVKFQLHNLDSRTLFHCNCTRRLARFLRRTKGPNEVEGEVLSNYVSAACFVLQIPPGCMEGESGHPNCIDVGKAVLTPARHLTNRLTPNFKGASIKVKRQEQMPQDGPVQLYDKCIQLARVVRHADHTEDLGMRPSRNTQTGLS